MISKSLIKFCKFEIVFKNSFLRKRKLIKFNNTIPLVYFVLGLVLVKMFLVDC